MPIIYTDRELLNNEDLHPGAKVLTDSPMIRMVRKRINGKSVFEWTRLEALKMYKWYCTGYGRGKVYNEFDEEIYKYRFSDLIKNSYYITDNNSISGFTIQEL